MSPKVLIIEDAKYMQNLLRDIFKKNGYEITGKVDNCHEGIERYKKSKPDLVTVDIIMPDMSGVEAIKEITAFDPNAKTIVVSALGHQALIDEAMKAGAKSYVVKPFTPSKIIEAAKKALE